MRILQLEQYLLFEDLELHRYGLRKTHQTIMVVYWKKVGYRRSSNFLRCCLVSALVSSRDERKASFPSTYRFGLVPQVRARSYR
jgi:hypothetical protein